MKRILFALTLILLVVCPAVAQEQTDRQTTPSDARAAGEKKTASKKVRSSARQTRQEAESARRRVWFFMSVGSVFDSNVNRDEESLNSFGLVPSMGVHFQNDAEKPSFEADYEIGFHRYTQTNEYNRVSHNFTGSYRRQLARKWQARTTAEISLKGSSEDRDVNNQYVLEQQIQYRINPRNRVRAFAAYRLKRYPLVDVGKNAVDPYVGARFEQTLRGGRVWEISYRYDKNRSQDPKDRYVRWTYGAQFSTPLFDNRRDLLTFEARYSPRLYARQVKVDGERVPRRDRRWTFDALYERPLTRDVQWGLNYRYETRDSNDPDKKFDSHLLGVTFGFKWWK